MVAEPTANSDKVFHTTTDNGLGVKRNSLLISWRAKISILDVTIRGRKQTLIEYLLCARHWVRDFEIFHLIFHIAYLFTECLWPVTRCVRR